VLTAGWLAVLAGAFPSDTHSHVSQGTEALTAAGPCLCTAVSKV